MGIYVLPTPWINPLSLINKKKEFKDALVFLIEHTSYKSILHSVIVSE